MTPRGGFPGLAMTNINLNVILAAVSIALLGRHAAAIREPCLWEESINITSGVVDSSGNYHHNGILYKPHQYGTYKYVIEMSERRTVRSHVRGCICAARGVPCLHYCCNDGSGCPDEITKDFDVNITEVATGESGLHNVHTRFQLIPYKPCEHMYVLLPEEFPDDHYLIYSVSTTDPIRYPSRD